MHAKPREELQHVLGCVRTGAPGGRQVCHAIRADLYTTCLQPVSDCCLDIEQRDDDARVPAPCASLVGDSSVPTCIFVFLISLGMASFHQPHYE